MILRCGDGPVAVICCHFVMDSLSWLCSVVIVLLLSFCDGQLVMIVICGDGLIAVIGCHFMMDSWSWLCSVVMVLLL